MTLILSIFILALFFGKEILIFNSEIVIIGSFLVLITILITKLSEPINDIFKTHSEDILYLYKKILDNQTLSYLTQKTNLELLIFENLYLTDLSIKDHFDITCTNSLMELDDRTTKKCIELTKHLEYSLYAREISSVLVEKLYKKPDMPGYYNILRHPPYLCEWGIERVITYYD